MHSLKRNLGVIVTVAFLAMAPLAAFAGIIYEGSDWSDAYGGGSVWYVEIHDGESDGNGAYAQFDTPSQGTNLRLNDPNGSTAGNGFAGPYIFVSRHKTCEDVSLLPDPCSSYHYEVP